jgi:hypothetical protein
MAPPKGILRSEETKAKMRAAWERRRAEGTAPPVKVKPPRDPNYKPGAHFRPGGKNYDPKKAARGKKTDKGGDGWGGPPKGVRDPLPEAEWRAREQAGRPAARSAAEAARPHAVEMVEVWRGIAMDDDAPPQARVIAADKLVERAEGKAVQPIVTAQAREPLSVDLDDLTPDQIEALDTVLLMLVRQGPRPQIEGKVETQNVDSSDIPD